MTIYVKVRYEDMKFHYITNHYDFHLEGTCWYDGKIARFESQDETDYQTMIDTCPSCKDGGTDDYKDCHCQNAPDVFCYIEELSFKDRIKARLYPYYNLFRFYIPCWGIKQGSYYWSRWFYRKGLRL